MRDDSTGLWPGWLATGTPRPVEVANVSRQVSWLAPCQPEAGRTTPSRVARSGRVVLGVSTVAGAAAAFDRVPVLAPIRPDEGCSIEGPMAWSDACTPTLKWQSRNLEPARLRSAWQAVNRHRVERRHPTSMRRHFRRSLTLLIAHAFLRACVRCPTRGETGNRCVAGSSRAHDKAGAAPATVCEPCVMCHWALQAWEGDACQESLLSLVSPETGLTPENTPRWAGAVA